MNPLFIKRNKSQFEVLLSSHLIFSDKLVHFHTRGAHHIHAVGPKLFLNINRKRKITKPFKCKNHVTDKEHFFQCPARRSEPFLESTCASLNHDRLLKPKKLRQTIIMEHTFRVTCGKDDLIIDFSSIPTVFNRSRVDHRNHREIVP